MIDTNGDTRKDLVFTDNKKFLNVIEYEKVSKESDNTFYKVVNSKRTNLEVLAKEIAKEISNTTQSITRYQWDRKQFDTYKEDLWFSEGKSGHGNNYLRIGRKATYRIPIYKFKKDSKKYKNCKAYKENIIETINIQIRGTARWGLDFVAICLAAIETGGIGAVVTLGGAALDVYEMHQSKKPYYDKAAKLYNEIKQYGEKE